MKRLLIYLGILTHIVLGCKKDSNNVNINCSNRFFYDGIGNKIVVQEVFNKGVISFYDTLSFDTISKILKQYKSIHLTDSIRTSFIIVTIDSKSCSETEELFSKIEKENKVSNCNKFLISNEETEIGLYDIFLCQLKSDLLKSHLNDLIIKTATRIIGYNNELRFYLIRADKYSKGDALDMANEFYESGYFEWSQPNFIEKIIFSK